MIRAPLCPTVPKTAAHGEADKALLLAAIADAQKICDDIRSDFTDIIRFLEDAIDDAQKVADDPNVTGEQIVPAIRAFLEGAAK